MARKGGYGRSEPVEWVKLSQISYAEAITSAVAIGQDVQTWFADAVTHHLYRCELLQAQERYQMDEAAAAASNRPTPDKNDQRYSITRPRPEITRSKGQSSAPEAAKTPKSRPQGDK
jgi:hypothetical protein